MATKLWITQNLRQSNIEVLANGDHFQTSCVKFVPGQWSRISEYQKRKFDLAQVILNQTLIQFIHQKL